MSEDTRLAAIQEISRMIDQLPPELKKTILEQAELMAEKLQALDQLPVEE